MCKIKLFGGKFALVSFDDYVALSGFRWHLGRKGQYAARKVNGSSVYMHRIIMRAKKGEQVDHINGYTLDNRRENLRICTPLENSANSAHRSGAKFGAHEVRGGWLSRVKITGDVLSLGFFKSKRDAQYCARAIYRLAYGRAWR